MMDQTLRCNSLRCRQVLTTQAVVTNCSHIFCVDWYVLRWLLLKKVQTNCSQTREPVHCVNLLSVNQTFLLSPLAGLSIGRLLNKLEPNRVVHFKNGTDGSDYKTVWPYSGKHWQQSVLSGLSPPTMVEILSRAMNFWCYQSNQEMFPSPTSFTDGRAYQEYLVKSLQEKYNASNSQLEAIIRDSNAEISRSSMSNWYVDN